jgi:imidazoleglycerol-phosphate dehydratase
MLDHMLAAFAMHGMFDLTVQATGDLEVDQHHTVEDVGICLGQAMLQALGDRKSIVRMGSAYVPLDEALSFAVVDISGRGYPVIELDFVGQSVGGLPVDLARHVLETVAMEGRINLHVRTVYGRNDHHKLESAFKAFARALDAATVIDPRRVGLVPSTKGVIEG